MQGLTSNVLQVNLEMILVNIHKQCEGTKHREAMVSPQAQLTSYLI